MIKSLKLKVFPEDKVDTFPDPSLGLGSRITIFRATKINITDAKVQKVYRTWTTTIKDLLKEQNIELLGQDSASPDINSKLAYNMNITITRVAEVEVKETYPIEYSTIKKTSVDIEKGDSEIERKGVNGEKEVTYLIRRVDGVEVSRSVKDTNITKESISEILIIGIGPKLAKSGQYLEIINAAAKKYLINGTALMCLMMNESGGDRYTIGQDDYGTYYGLFQYKDGNDGFFSDISPKAGYGGADWSNAEAQIYTTAWALTHGYSGRWPWGSCSGK